MNQASDILPSATFELPFEPSAFEPTLPPEAENTSPLPASLIDALKFAAPWVSHCSIFPDDGSFLEFIHVAGRKVYASNKSSVVEYDLGDADVPWFAIHPKQIRPLASFGEPPSHFSRCIPEPLLFEWENGSRLSLEFSTGRGNPSFAEKYASLIVERNDLEPITDEWKARIAGRFLRKIPGRETDLLHISDGKISGGVGVTLETETYCDGDVYVERPNFLRMIKIADKIKFAEVKGFFRIYFEARNVRGVLSTRKPG